MLINIDVTIAISDRVAIKVNSDDQTL